MRKYVVWLALAGGLPFAASGQTVINGGREVSGAWDAGNAASTRPAKTGTALPATCTPGAQFFRTDATPGQNLYLCTAPDTWTQLAPGGGGGGDVFSGASASVDSEVALFSGTSGKVIKRATGSGVAKITNGVLGTVAGAASDCVKADGSSGPCAAESPLTAKGDLWGFSSANARIPVGQDGQVLSADSTQAAGVKWANQTPLTTKGDLLGFSSANARIAVGQDGQVLTADSTQAAGVKWANAALPVTKVLQQQMIPLAGSDNYNTARPAGGVSLPATNSPVPEYSDLTSYRVPSMRFSKGTADLSLYATVALPPNYDGGSITLSIRRSTGWTAGSVVWNVQAACTGSAWGSPVQWATVTDVHSGTPSYGLLSFGTFPGSCPAGSMLTIILSRLCTSASDTLNGNANMNQLLLQYKAVLE